MDGNYGGYRIDVGYRVTVAPRCARSYIEGGKEDFCGFAVDVAQVSGVTEVGDLIDLFCGAIAPVQFSPSEPIRILEVPASPLVQASRAVGAFRSDTPPVAILRYLAQIEVLHTLQGRGAPLAYALSVSRGDFENTETVLFPDGCPSMLEHIVSEDWQEKLEYFPATRSPSGLDTSWTDEGRAGRTEPLNRGRRTANLDKAGETVKIKNTDSTGEGAQ